MRLKKLCLIISVPIFILISPVLFIVRYVQYINESINDLLEKKEEERKNIIPWVYNTIIYTTMGVMMIVFLIPSYFIYMFSNVKGMFGGDYE